MNGHNRMRWLLIGSLALNLFLGGLFIGQWVAGLGHERHHGRPSMRLSLGAAMQQLPPESREMAHRVMERHRPATRAAFEAMRQAHARVGAALQAEPFEPEALDAAFAAYRKASGEARAEMHRALAEVAADLPPEARRAMVENMARRAERRRRPPPERE